VRISTFCLRTIESPRAGYFAAKCVPIAQRVQKLKHNEVGYSYSLGRNISPEEREKSSRLQANL